MKKGKTRNRVLAWILTMAMVLTMTPVTAFAEEEWAATASADSPIDAHEHDNIVYNQWPENASGTILSGGNYFLTGDVTLTAGVQINGNVNLCLNGHTLTINPSANKNYKNLFYVKSGKTLSIYDCAGTGKITGGQGYYDRKNYKGGAIYLKEATLNLYGGSIEGNSATWGGAIFVDATSKDSIINMCGGSIQNNTAELGGGGIELENDQSTLNMFGGSIVNNTVTKTDGGCHKGGGVHHAKGTLNIDGTSGDVQISGNTVAGVENNVYLRSGRVITVKGMTANSRIGVSAYDVEKTTTATTATKVTSGYGSSASEITNFFMDRTHSNTTYALVQKGTELQIVSHSHTWNYEVNKTGTEIQAYCTNKSPQCGYYGTQESHENALTLTLSAADAPYSGSPYSGASVKNNITSITGDTVNVEYCKDSEKLSSAPTDAGTYTVKVTIGGATVSRKFTISKVDAAYTTPIANTRTYDGTAQSLVSGGTATGGEMYYRLGTDGTWTTTIPTAVKAGDYVVYYYVKADENHNSIGSEISPNGSVNVTIGRKTLTEDMISLDFTKKDYTGSKFTPIVTAKDMKGEANLITADDYTIDGTTEATEVGDYTITVTGKGNYTGSIQKDWRIKGLDFTASDISAANVTKTYDGSSYGISVSVTKSGVQDVEVRYKDDNGNYTLTECPTYSDASSTPYMIEYEVTAKGYNAYRNSATVTINPKEVELEWSNISLTYNGTEQKPTVNVKEDSLCGNDTCTVILGEGKTDSNAKAGEASYSITVTRLDNSNYKLPSEAEQLTKNYTIAQKEVGLDWSNTTFTYDGASHKPTASLNGVVANDTCNVIVTGEQTNAGTDYTAIASIDNANYKIKTSDGTKTFVINPKEITEDMISLNDTDSIYDFTNSAITPVVTVKDGEVVLTGGETGDYVLAGDLTRTAYGSYEITVSGKGNYTGTPKVVWRITDPNAPKGEIVLKKNKWNSFLNTITFGLFFKSTQQVTVNATDGVNESGVDKISYCVSDTLLTDSASLDSAKWTQISNGGSFNINPNAKVCVYVKITDKAGNAAYISSNGIVVYTDSARDTDKITFTKTSAEDVTATVTLNGNTISKVTNGTTELTKGSHYTISADGATITFKASYLQTLSAGDYTINVSYNPMGETYVDAKGNDQPVDTSITLSVKRVSSDNADTKITNKDNLSKEYNGQPTEAATPSSKNGSKPKVEYKKKGDPDSSYTEEVPKDAGDYVVRVTYPQDENYEETSATEEFTISPKAVTAVVSVSTKIYNGTTDAEVTATVDTGITGQTLTITGLTGTFDDKNAGTGKTVTINSTNAQITAGEGTNAANYKITYPATATGNITAKTLNAVVSAANKVYDGKTDAEVTATVETEIGEETLTITGLTGSFKDQNVEKDKNVSIDSTGASVQAGAGTSADNYTVVYPDASTASITARPVTLTWSSADLTYTGSEQEVTAEVSNKASGADSFTITYTNNKKTAVGEYAAKVTDLGNSNYTLTGAKGSTKNWSISYLVTDAKAAPSGDTRNDSGWFTGTVTLTPDSGYRISKDGTKWSDTLTVIDDGESTVTYYLKGRNGSITDQKTVTIKKDSTAPGGEIKVGENSFTKFLNTITFGYFFKNTVDVEISGTDATSGIAKIEYQKVAKGETYNADGTWTAGTSFSMTANDKSVIYARITDVAGNTVIINSKGIVVYTDATTSDSVEYTRTTKTDVTSAIELKGNTVEEIRNGNTVLTEGTDYEIKDSRIVLKGEYLEKLSVGDYCLSVSYNPYGEVYGEDAHGIKVADSTIKVTVKRADSESADTKITNKDKLSKEYDGQQTEAAAPSSKNGSTPKVEYKKKGNPDSSFTEEVPKDAGNYVVRVTYPQDENYEETSVTEEFTISPKAVTAVVSVSTKTYNGTTDAEVTATVDTGITGQTLTITGLTGTFDDKNAGTGKTVTINSTNAQVTAGADTDASNYSITYPAESTGSIQAASLTIKVNDASKHIGKADPAFGYSVITGILVEGDSISGIIFTRTAGETAGTYDITATEKVGSNPNYNITITDGTLTIEDHTLVTDAAIAATCTETGLTAGKHCSVCNEVLVAQEEVAAKGHTEVVDEAVAATCTETGLTEGKHCSVCNEVLVAQKEVAAKGHTEVVDEAVEATCTTAGKTAGSHCSVCNEVIVAQKEVPALGHDWSGEWTIVKEATATTDGKRETICTRDGCGQKKYETIPATGTPEEPENPNAGKLDKDAEVEPDAPIDEATLDNKKSELLDAHAIFTEAEKQQIQSGTDARVWIEVKGTDESSIPTEDKKEVTKEAEKIMGENPMITYFDADLFKQVEGEDKTQIHEPGIDIQVTILIPDELLNHDRTMVREYKIIRLHYDAVTGESKVDVLSGDFDRGTGEFSFKTDKFSTFAIAYTDIQLVTGITLTADSATLTGSGETVQLTAIVAPDNAVNKNVIWTSSDPNVATVDANGKVTAVGNGTCTITATTEDGGFTAICTIKVEIPDSDNGGNNGDNNSGDNNQSNEDANTPANTKEDKKPNVEAPKTGDASNVTLWSLLLALSALALAGIGVARRKRSSSIEK